MGGLVKDKDGIRLSLPDLPGQLQTLSLPAGESWSFLSQGQIPQNPDPPEPADAGGQISDPGRPPARCVYPWPSAPAANRTGRIYSGNECVRPPLHIVIPGIRDREYPHPEGTVHPAGSPRFRRKPGSAVSPYYRKNHPPYTRLPLASGVLANFLRSSSCTFA